MLLKYTFLLHEAIAKKHRWYRCVSSESDGMRTDGTGHHPRSIQPFRPTTNTVDISFLEGGFVDCLPKTQRIPMAQDYAVQPFDDNPEIATLSY